MLQNFTDGRLVIKSDQSVKDSLHMLFFLKQMNRNTMISQSDRQILLLKQE